MTTFIQKTDDSGRVYHELQLKGKIECTPWEKSRYGVDFIVVNQHNKPQITTCDFEDGGEYYFVCWGAQFPSAPFKNLEKAKAWLIKEVTKVNTFILD